MNSKEILNTYLDFYKSKGHKQIPNMSLIPEGDSTLLYVNSGMFPLVPYLSGQPHPLGKRLVNYQRALRFFEDLENIGDKTHTTAFHMIGNWSLGDYFKTEQLSWMYEFYVEKLGLDVNKIYGTVFKGDERAPKDTESIELIKQIFNKYGIDAKEGERIFALGNDNWWQRGNAIGELGGPSSEIFYYVGKDGDGFGKNIEEYDDEFLEIGNSVFMQYVLNKQMKWVELPQRNVDFGGGLERIALVSQGKTDIYETDNFWPIILKIEELSGKKYRDSGEVTRAMRIVADHMRGSVFMIMDGVTPSNKDQGYILRRLIRRMVRFGYDINIEQNMSANLVDAVVEVLGWLYPVLVDKKEEIKSVFSNEETKFRSTLKNAVRSVEKELDGFSGSDKELSLISFNLYQSAGYPPEMFLEEVDNRGVKIDLDKFWDFYNKLIQEHQGLSRKGAEQKFKGGLADSSVEVTRYHTATHLLQKALKTVLGETISQKGSNNTKDRLRFDFNFERALTETEIKEVEKIINEKITEGLNVNSIELEKEEALNTGAYHLNAINYPEKVTVYYTGDLIDNAYSKEFCGGPHVKNTSEIGQIEIYKQESVSDGVRRICLQIKK